VKRVNIPEFELVGPSCRQPNCDGKLIVTILIKEKKICKKCSVCNKNYNMRDLRW